MLLLHANQLTSISNIPLPSQKLVARCLLCSRERLLAVKKHLSLFEMPIVEDFVAVMTLDYLLFETKFKNRHHILKTDLLHFLTLYSVVKMMD